MFADPRTCKHEQAEMRCRPDKNGNKRYLRQCLTCGQRIGNWVKRLEAQREANLESIPLFIENLASEKIAVIDEARTDAVLEVIRPTYEDYLQSPDWKAKRQLVLKRANGICEGCGVNNATEVHHFWYDNLGREFLWELAAVCEDCHDRAHPWKLPDGSSRARAIRQQLFHQLENSPLFQEKIRKILEG